MINASKILVSGVNSGLGKYIYDSVPNVHCLTRKNRDEVLSKDHEYDLIIHCAFNTKNAGKNKVDNTFEYIDDNVLLTNDLVSLHHKKFAYISSIAVYDAEPSPYSQTKLFAESIVQKKANKSLIVRCSSLLGASMRSNTVTRIIQDSNPKITLSKDTTYNFISHKDVFDFIIKAYDRDISGVFDFVASDYLKLEDITKHLNVDVGFGDYTFTTNKIDNKKLVSIFPEFNKSSWEVLNDFIEEIR